MKRISSIVAAVGILANAPAMSLDMLKQGQELLTSVDASHGSAGKLSADEIGSGLRDALRVGTERVVQQLGTEDGFNGDPSVHIPLPKSMHSVQSALEKFGMSGMLDDLELRLNRAAEAATPKAKQLFWDAISEMTLEDARQIYDGPDDAATRYFQAKMSQPLAAEMSPIVSNSLSSVGAIHAYENVMGEYEQLPFMPDVKANLTDYVVEKGMDGIFHYLAKEEAAIRNDPLKRTTALLQRVFGAD